MFLQTMPDGFVKDSATPLLLRPANSSPMRATW